MTTVYPGAVDALARPGSTTYTDDSGYELDLVIDNISDAVEAVETKLGTASSTAARNKGLVGSGSGASVWDSLARPTQLLNGQFNVWQRGTSISLTTDNAYGPDRWRLLVEAANAATLTRETSDVPTDGGKEAAKLTVGASNNNKFGIWQIIEGVNAKRLRGRTISLQVKLKATSGITDVRMAAVEWTGTEDAVSADPISSWGSAGTNPTLIASYAYLGTPSNLTPTTSWATYRVEGLTVGASANNLAIFIWCDDKTTTASTDILRVTDAKVEEGAVCTELQITSFTEELQLCQRYYETSYDYGTGAATNTVNGLQQVMGDSTGNQIPGVRFSVPKRAVLTSTNFKVYGKDGTVDRVSNTSYTNHGNSCTVGDVGHKGCRYISSTSFTSNAQYNYHWVADAEL